MYVRVQNFQSIRDVEFEIEGLTAIVGPSSIGKSALWRAISYPLHAKLGNEFVRQGEDFARVTIQDEDFKMVWEKGPGVNQFYFNDDPNPVPKIKKGDIPQQILEAGFGDIVLRNPEGKVKHRLSAQFAPQLGGNVFLLDDSPQLVAEVLSQLSRLDVLMKAVRSTELDIKRSNTLLKVRREDEKRLQNKADSFSGLSAASHQIASLKERAGVLQEAKGRYERAEASAQRLRACKRELERLAPLKGALIPGLPEESELLRWSRVSEVASKYRRASRILVPLQQLSGVEIPELGSPDKWSRAHKLATTLRISRATRDMELPEIPELPDWERYQEVWNLHVEQVGAALKVRRVSKDLEELQLDIDKNDLTLEEIKKQLKICPTCERPFDGSH